MTEQEAAIAREHARVALKRKQEKELAALAGQNPSAEAVRLLHYAHKAEREAFEAMPVAPPPVEYPFELTEPLRQALSVMLWESGKMAVALRGLGHEVKKRAEEEQAAVLHFLIPYAIRHGDEWWERARADLNRGLERAREALDEAKSLAAVPTPRPEEEA